ncbi:hypothetical protein QJS10_CPA02g00523 [Acorus calamus]|uniref:Dihydrolipoamide acetyltransferase component of pyruvate dehydrogenase complex n=1 Tax=Acorus calamus TaxID=4465 RepID=A0AAV9FFB9_ACOCL|nr:hypothetical protein QJS10_CPA02g00523 [Acorus calamus]
MAGLLRMGTSFIPSPSKPLRPSITTVRSRRPRPSSTAHAKIREIFMPALSSTMTEGKIVSWVKSEGDRLSKGESVVVVESDKADMDVETFYDGFLAKIIVDEGGTAAVGSAIALLAESEDEIAAAQSTAAAAPKEEKQQETTPPPSPPPPPPSAPSKVLASVSTHPASEGGTRVVATPYAKKLAKDLNVELGAVVGTGPMGRIVAKDVEAAAATGTVAAPVKAAVESVKSVVELGSTVPFTTMQGAVSRNMVESLSVPTFRVGYTITTDALDDLYKRIKSKGVTMTALLAKATAMALTKHPVVNSACKDGKSFTYNSSINIAVAVAIDGGLITPVLRDADKVDIYSLSRKWKELVDKARAKQLQPQEYSTGNVIEALELNIINGYTSVHEKLSYKKREFGTWSQRHFGYVLPVLAVSSPGTFTLSNLGMFGVDRFDAILPPGTGAIMAVGASHPTVVATKDGKIGVKNQMQVNVTTDHRIIYGADLASFLQTLAKIIEDPKDLTL